MRIKTIAAAGMLAVGVVAGGTAIAHADVYEGTYYSRGGCEAAGQNYVDSPATAYTRWTCQRDDQGNWDLWLG